VVGLDSWIRIQYDPVTVEETNFKLGSLKIDIRTRPHINGKLIASKTTGDGITWEEDTLVVHVTAQETSEIRDEKVFFDIIHSYDGIVKKLSGQWEWPVERSITINEF